MHMGAGRHKMVALAVAGLLLTAWPAMARAGGGGGHGGGGGGGHSGGGGGFHGGGGGGFHGAPGFRGGPPGGFAGRGFDGRRGFDRGFDGRGFDRDFDRRRGFDRDFDRRRGFGFDGFGWPGYWGWDYPGYGYGYGGYPYGGYYGDYGYPMMYPPYYGYGHPPADYMAAYPPIPVAESTAVLLNVTVPAGAELWVDGHKTSQTGAVRQFTSPPLAAGKDYTYELRAKWKDGGRTVEQSRTVH